MSILEGHLPAGLYERVIDEGLAGTLKQFHAVQAEQVQIPVEEGHFYYPQYIAGLLRAVLRTQRSENAQRSIVNRVIELLASELPGSASNEDRTTGAVLHALIGGLHSHLGKVEVPPRPGIPLSRSELLVNAPGEYRIGSELESEIHSADRIDLLCSFIKWSGLRLMLEALKQFADKDRVLRVITTVYMGATEKRALDALVRIGARVRISHDTRRTRLHAKAWLFHRRTGYTTAYIGSSNLSAAAQLEGLEWNVRVSSVDAEQIVRKFEATFDAYWKDSEFVPYEATSEEQKHLELALIAQQGEPDKDPLLPFDIRPYPFQQEILERLEVEREVHGRTRNLVVAATGTGKTIIAALDYRRLIQERRALTLLFVAHREEILKQSRQVFRHALRDPDFGELLVGGEKPVKGNHVFASVQSLSRMDLSAVDPAAYDMVIIDEFHHAAAPTYKKLLDHFQPDILLGLTATPERADGKSILHWFGGRTAAELRLWDAIDRGLLAPFQYFGVHDGMDLTRLRWRRGGYESSELENLYTGNKLRLRLIVQSLVKHVADIQDMRALGFCVSVAHAEYMAAGFREAGIPAMALTGGTPRDERRAAIGRLRSRDVNILFTVDLFNEGVDIPEVDTLLLLRPTQSATVFLQQLGRGLRLHPGKICLTVLDFIGMAREEFRYEATLGALSSSRRTRLQQQIEHGFPLLPSGCSIQLDRKSREEVLRNVRRAIKVNRNALVQVVAKAGPHSGLRHVLDEAGIDVGTFYRNGRSLTGLRRAAGFDVESPGPEEQRIARGLGRLLHVDDKERLNYYAKLVESGPSYGAGEAGERRRLMLLSVLFGKQAATNPEAYHSKLRSHTALCAEMEELMGLLEVSHKPLSAGLPPDIPLFVHCRYRREELIAAFNYVGGRGLKLPLEGLVYVKPSRCNLLLVTLRKSKKLYSPTTMYEDYAVSRTLFHWQSPGRTRPGAETGKRIIHHEKEGITPLLFARLTKRSANGDTVPYVFLGPLKYLEHEGERPMNVMWEVRTPMPADFMRKARVAA